MNSKTRTWLGTGVIIGASVLAAGGAWLAGAGPARAGVPIVVYKNPNCGCCTKWADRLKAQGFDPEVRPVKDLNAIKRQVGVPVGMSACHTARLGKYFIEGHVPASDIRRLLKQPDIAGLVVPGMPLGSPGMEVPGRRPMAYKVYAIDRQGRARVFASH